MRESLSQRNLFLSGLVLSFVLSGLSLGQDHPISAEDFGMHIQWQAPWPTIPFGSWRVPVAWSWVEPQPGVWNFERPDTYLKEASEHGNPELLFSLGYSAPWASSKPNILKSPGGPGGCAPPKNIDDWRGYVKALGERYKGKVKYYEVWNEPTVPFFWCGSTSDLVNLTRATSEVLKQIDPANQILSPSAVTTARLRRPIESGIGWVNDFLRHGGGNYVDIIAFHFYFAPSPPEGIYGAVKALREVMDKNGVGDKPIWDTEDSWGGEPLDPDTEAGYVARVLLMDFSAGVSRTFWYAWGAPTVKLRLSSEDMKSASPAGVAFKVVQDWLIGGVLKSCTSSDIPSAFVASHAMWTCELQQGASEQKIVWNPDGDKDFKIPPAWHVSRMRDLSGGSSPIPASGHITIGGKPILLDQGK